ncbi:hypothetical protein [Rothia nasimurium]|uniref:hypothetical protein n=1 Tax=Rothia nasimurium TaxID=85336 RepID=UPI001F1C80AE|nr:hypothetical protein [Rothia nasimurium]
MTLTEQEAHTWFRAAGAPLVIPARERARWTLARSAPLSAWLIVSSFTYLALLWGLAQLDVEAQDGGVPVDVPDSVLTPIFIALALVPPLLLLVVPWAVSRLLEPLPFWRQTLIGALLLPLAAFSMLPQTARWIGLADVADAFAAGDVLWILGATLLAVYLGLDSLCYWALRQVVKELAALSSMVVKVLPVLMIAVLFFFVNGDIWRVAAALSMQRTLQVVAILTVLSFLVVSSTVTEKTRRLLGARKGDKVEEFTDAEYAGAALQAGDRWRHELENLPAAGLGRPADFRWGEWNNLVLLPIVVQMIQAVLFAGVVFLFFVWFGTIAIPDATITSWLGFEASKVTLLGVQFPFTDVLVKVSMVLGAFAALNFAAQTSTDSRYAEEFLEPAIGQVRRTVMVRNIYRARHGSRRC